MDLNDTLSLSRRERQIMDVLHRRGRATATEITSDLEDAPTNTTVRTLLRILVEKGQAVFERDGARYVYRPAASREAVGASMMGYVVRTFFEGSPDKAMAALLGNERDRLDETQVERLERLLAEAKAEPR
jgi:predicted transcriptional regulator